MSVSVCRSNTEIPRVRAEDLSQEEFQERYFETATPVIITGATEDWPARRTWTIESLMERVGSNEVWIRGRTNEEDYRVGKAYTIRRATFSSYCRDLLKGNARARSSYLAVASMQVAFPQLIDDVPLPKYLNGKLHLGPYMWVALKGHYEFCHYDPDDNFLIMIRGRKRVRLFGYDLRNMYPNPSGSLGKTIQSRVNCDAPDLKRFPNFAEASCQYAILDEGEMMFIPAFMWHQISALDTGISINVFYGDAGECNFLEKILKPPYFEHFKYWLLNIIDQNRNCDSFQRMLSRLDEVVYHFFIKHWHETPNSEQVRKVVRMIAAHLELKTLSEKNPNDKSKFPPVLKIRGLLHRN